MIDAKWLPTYDTEAEGQLFLYGVWIPRRGDNVRMTIEVVANMSAVLTATIFEKNYDEVGNGDATAAEVVFDATTGRQTLEALGVKELVRLQFKLAPHSELEEGIGKILYRVLQPAWFESLSV